jgi:hypothetical protein
MTTNILADLEKIYPTVVELMPDTFDSHDFILRLAQQYQKLYIQALYEHTNRKRPFHGLHMAIAKRLKKHRDLVEHIDNQFSKDIFGQENKVAVWSKVK